MKDEKNCGSIAIIVLNYLTYNETEEFLSSIKKFYPNIRIIIVDNGSPIEIVNKLNVLSKKYKNTSVHPIGKNLGFAKGNNYGIKIALNEGYKYIICSNNDVLIKDKNILFKLKNSMDLSGSSLIGPKIINLRGINQNPLMIKRPTLKQAKEIYRGSSFLRILALSVFPKKIISFIRKMKHALNKTEKEGNDFSNVKSSYVYALHGSFLMFGPKFFENYNGFDDGTFLFGEELILAEMLYQKKLKAFYEPGTYVVHKEDATSKVVWGGQKKMKPLLYARKSTKRWYKEFYIKTNQILQGEVK